MEKCYSFTLINTPVVRVSDISLLKEYFYLSSYWELSNKYDTHQYFISDMCSILYNSEITKDNVTGETKKFVEGLGLFTLDDRTHWWVFCDGRLTISVKFSDGGCLRSDNYKEIYDD